MNSKSSFLIVVMIAATTVFESCGKPPQPSEERIQNTTAIVKETTPVAPKNESSWATSTQSSSDHSVVLTRKVMRQEEQELNRNQYRQTALVSVPIDPSFNVQLFKINNVEAFTNAVFIAPKLFAYGPTEKGRMAVQYHGDGTITLSFPVVFTDGVRSLIAPPNENGTPVPLPQALIINDLPGLRTAVNDQFGKNQVLSDLPGCPKRIFLKSGANEYDVTPVDLAKGDNCQMGTPFTVSVRIATDDALFMLQEALYKDAVELRAVFETRVPFETANLTVEFNKAKLFESLQAELNVQAGFWVDADARTALQRAVKSQAMKIQIQGELAGPMANIVEQAMKDFFTTFVPDPSEKIKTCQGGHVVCLRLNYEYSHSEQTFKVTWRQTTTALTGQNYLTWAKLQALQDSVVNIGIEPKPMLVNNGKRLETGLTVMPRDLVEITPAFMKIEQRNPEISTPVRADNPVCIHWHPVYETQIRHRFLGAGARDGEGGSREEEIQVQVGEECDLWENRWVETISYSIGSNRYKTFHDPVAVGEQLYGGLSLEFEWLDSKGKPKSVTCPLNAFERRADGKSMLIRVENKPGCQIFTENLDSAPMMFIKNNIEIHPTYKYGRDVKRWDGTVLERHLSDTFRADVGLGMTIAIKGYGFATYASRGRAAQ